MKKEYRIIHRHRQLKYRGRSKGEERYRPKNYIASHIYYDRDPHDPYEQHGLKPGRGSDRKDRKDDHERYDHSHGHFLHYSLLPRLVAYSRARKISVLADYLIYPVQCLMCGLFRASLLKYHIDQRIPVLIVVIQGIRFSREGICHVDIRSRIRASNHVHAFH